MTHSSLARKLGLPAAALSIALLTACGGGGSQGDTDPAQPLPTDTVTGTVTFKGAPLAGAQVLLYTCNSNYFAQTATTDANGGFSFAGLGTTGDCPAEWLFWVMKDGYGFLPCGGQRRQGGARRLQQLPDGIQHRRGRAERHGHRLCLPDERIPERGRFHRLRRQPAAGERRPDRPDDQLCPRRRRREAGGGPLAGGTLHRQPGRHRHRPADRPGLDEECRGLQRRRPGRTPWPRSAGWPAAATG